MPCAHPDRPNARMHLVVHVPGRGTPVHTDVSIASALSAEALEARWDQVDGRAAAIAAARKHTNYPLIDVAPFIVDGHGRFGTEAITFVKQLAPVDLVDRTNAMHLLYHWLSSVLQRHAADTVLAAVAPSER